MLSKGILCVHEFTMIAFFSFLGDILGKGTIKKRKDREKLHREHFIGCRGVKYFY